MSLLVSVLMPVYNAEPHLDEAIRSIRAQTHRDLELVLVNDGSTDGSLVTMQRHAAEDDRVVVVDRPNGGIVAALNAGLAVCRGDYIARMDGDDLAHADRLERQLAYLEANPSIDLVGGQVDLFGEYAPEAGETRNNSLTHDEIDKHSLEQGGGALMHPTFFARKNLYDGLGGYRESYPYAEDYDFLLRAAEAGKLACLAESVIRYRLHANQVTVHHRRKQLTGMILALTAAGKRRGISVNRSLARMWVVSSWCASEAGEFGDCLRCALTALRTAPTRPMCYRAVVRAIYRYATRQRAKRTAWGVSLEPAANAGDT